MRLILLILSLFAAGVAYVLLIPCILWSFFVLSVQDLGKKVVK